jgi:hypothetical protein
MIEPPPEFSVVCCQGEVVGVGPERVVGEPAGLVVVTLTGADVLVVVAMGVVSDTEGEGAATTPVRGRSVTSDPTALTAK